MNSKKYKRRQYILKNTSQPKYIFSYFILFATGLLLFSLLFSFMSMETTTITYYNNQISIGNTPYMLMKKMLGSGWIIIVLGGGLLFVMSVMMTHRVAGPAYRIEKSLERMLDDDFGFKIVLRKNDEMKPVAKKLETLSFKIKWYRDDILKHKNEFDELIASLNLKEEDKKKLKEKNNELAFFLNLN
ncbi:MAG: methyl-accepting chemotaxis protein [Desulforegulaceae bacterium]|jgi:methyl-accepting chemotaxis protein|nr:methyl-accepting chemotaxis protein [Desulforegulaceae bacterium]